ncbi:hypothetical protein NBRC116493_20950 [Aurantivibrio infirmus]
MSLSRLSTLPNIATGLLIGFSVAFSSLLVAADAQEIKAAMEKRHENFEMIGESFKTIRDQARSGNADVAKVTEAATTINTLAKQIDTWFPAGSGPESGNETEAKAEIWQKPEEFSKAAQRLVDESAKYIASLNSEGASAVPGGIRTLGGSCKNCHDAFREEDE